MGERTAARTWRFLWLGAATLIFAQLLWWLVLFLGQENRIGALRTDVLRASQPTVSAEALEAVHHETRRRRFMILCEVLFFGGAVGSLFWLLYRAFRREERDRQMQQDFLEIVAHESKTPLTALKLRLEAGLEETEPAAKDVEMREALSDSRRLAMLFDKAIQLYRLEQNPLFLERFALAEPVEEALRSLDALVRRKGARVDVVLDRSVLVQGDRSALGHAALCLVENALLYSDAQNPQVELRLFAEQGTAVLTVADDGPGIAPAVRRRLFERFARGKTGGPVPGTGLGLYLARRVATMHRGALRLCEEPGLAQRGCRFELALELAKDTEARS